ncbi:MAG: hypothetical protein EOO77_12675 [Oxalobacteraceae bacterium]|nr:MAG: hypothetical protein EOO77_12675 [Oxalobacteraceae bacterium]
MRLGWSRKDLARYNGVNVASVYLIERFGSSTANDDARMRDTLARGLNSLETDPRNRENATNEAAETSNRLYGSNSRSGQAGDQYE